MFADFDRQLKERGYLAMGGQIVDATLVAARQAEPRITLANLAYNMLILHERRAAAGKLCLKKKSTTRNSDIEAKKQRNYPTIDILDLNPLRSTGCWRGPDM